MENDNKNIVIKVEDHYGDNCIVDKTKFEKDSNNKNRAPLGFVEIYEDEKLVGKHNLVLYYGREWIVQRAVDTNNTQVTPTQNEALYWFGIGSGGTASGDPLTPLSVDSSDTELSQAVPIHVNDAPTSSTYTDRRDGSPGNYYKKAYDSVAFNQDPANDNKYLITKITVIIDNDDCNDTTLVSGKYNNHLNEAALYVCSTSQGGQSQTGPWNIYSRVTFPTIVKDSSRQLTLIWYLYF